MKKKFIIIVICSQLVLISYVLWNIMQKNGLKTIHSTPLKKETMITTESATLRYFYEPKPNTIIQAEEPLYNDLENIFYYINNDGLHQHENTPIMKASDTYRIITIGDSNTFGMNVPTQDNYPSLLNTLLNEKLFCPSIKKFEVLNFGVSGYDFQYTVERFKKRGIKYDPDLVLWLLIYDDFRRINELLIPRERYYIQEAKKNGEYQQQIAKGEYYIQSDKARREITSELGGEDKILTLQEKFLQQLNDVYSGKLAFLYDKKMPITYQNFLHKYTMKKKNILLYDALPTRSLQDETALPDFHPSKKGHKQIAEHVLQYLVKNNLIPCSLK